MQRSNTCGGGIDGGGGSHGPCGACKFLRRKCVKGCIFAPYFDSEQGASHFAAVHKIFGASNVSKLLLRLPVHKRPNAVVTICYEALARIRDPVYGCVGHIFSLQQQVVNLQAELAFVQANLSSLELSYQPMLPPQPHSPAALNFHSPSTMASTSNVSANFEPEQLQTALEMETYCNFIEQPADDGDLHALAREFVSRYLPGVKVQTSSSS